MNGDPLRLLLVLLAVQVVSTAGSARTPVPEVLSPSEMLAIRQAVEEQEPGGMIRRYLKPDWGFEPDDLERHVYVDLEAHVTEGRISKYRSYYCLKLKSESEWKCERPEVLIEVSEPYSSLDSDCPWPAIGIRSFDGLTPTEFLDAVDFFRSQVREDPSREPTCHQQSHCEIVSMSLTSEDTLEVSARVGLAAWIGVEYRRNCESSGGCSYVEKNCTFSIAERAVRPTTSCTGRMARFAAPSPVSIVRSAAAVTRHCSSL